MFEPHSQMGAKSMKLMVIVFFNNFCDLIDFLKYFLLENTLN